jgi:hypothetical protein
MTASPHKQTNLSTYYNRKPHTHRSTPHKSTPLKTCSHEIQTHQQKPSNMATRKDDIIINSRGCLLKGTTFLILLLKDFSFIMPITPSYVLFLISLSFRRHRLARFKVISLQTDEKVTKLFWRRELLKWVLHLRTQQHRQP